MVRPFLSTSDIAIIDTAKQQAYVTAKLLWRDTYFIQRTSRPGGWDTGSEPEDEDTVETGICKLISNGPGPGDTADAVIVGLTPYRVKLDAETVLDPATDMLVVNGREFLVNDLARGTADKTIVEASVTERNGGG